MLKKKVIAPTTFCTNVDINFHEQHPPRFAAPAICETAPSPIFNIITEEIVFSRKPEFRFYLELYGHNICVYFHVNLYL